MRMKPWCPTIRTNCADCGVGTLTIDEWYRVKERVWKLAWAGRLKPWHALPGQQILCIDCLEKRIGRTLVPSDFRKIPVNDPAEFDHSDRLLNRLGWLWDDDADG